MRYEFDEYCLDVARQELRRGADLVPTEPQVIDLLHYLIRNRERVVSKNDLIAHVWNGRVVSDSALTSRIAKARQAVGDTGHDRRLIRTLPRKGIRFVGEVRQSQYSDATIGKAQPLVLSLPDRPSIAVLPFINLSGDPEQDYFADGMVEDIITALSRFKSLFVIARNSSFAFKNKTVDIKQVGRELGVRYVLEGSVRKSGNRIRITGQLIETAGGAHQWADAFDGTLDDVFGLQDAVTMRVVGSIVARVDQSNVDALKRKPPENWDSYDHYWRGRMWLRVPTVAACVDALAEFRKAIDLDPSFALAHAFASYSYFWRRFIEKRLPNVDERTEALRYAELAAELDSDDHTVLAMVSNILAHLFREYERAGALADRALALNPNSSMACCAKGWSLVLRKLDLDHALKVFDRAIRLNPLDREMLRPAWFGKAVAYQNLERYEEGANCARSMLAQDPTDLSGLFLLERCCFYGGQIAEARIVAKRIREAYPNLRASFMRVAYAAEHSAIVDESIVRLGLPE